MLYPVVLSGGSGTRLWPLSRVGLPKQFLPLTSEYTMLQETVLRLRDMGPAVSEPVAATSVVCNQEHRFLIAEQLRKIEVDPQVLMLEPFGRNTAPAIATISLHLLSRVPAEQASDVMLLVLPADHVIADVPQFHQAIRQALDVARQGYLVTFGIVPRGPETGYGYIQRGEPLGDQGAFASGAASDATANGNAAISFAAAGATRGGTIVKQSTVNGLPGTGNLGGEIPHAHTAAYSVARFVEKPDLSTARRYIEAGDYFWNSGMFLFSAEHYLQELERFSSQVIPACRAALEHAYSDLDFLRLGEKEFKTCPSCSIDYAVMEKTDKAAVVPADIGWNDVGSWAALHEIHPKDEDGNTSRGTVFLQDTRNCYINAEKRLVATIGVEDLIIVETTDAVLVAHKDHAQDVKKIVNRLQQEGRTEHKIHPKVYRPWGSYEGMDRGERFQVKRLIVNPGEQSSMQMHYHRSEHWVVVSGTAEVTLGDEVRLIPENESIYIPLGVSHRIHNPGRIPLHLIEVQSGPYLGEDDIVRTEDNYGRG
jgi:mannose-1-phosphate guanylyltransferase / mannose-6-phosphate isomerase